MVAFFIYIFIRVNKNKMEPKVKDIFNNIRSKIAEILIYLIGIVIICALVLQIYWLQAYVFKSYDDNIKLKYKISRKFDSTFKRY